MTQEDQKIKILFLVLIGVASFAGGLLFLAVMVIILWALGVFAL